MRPEFEGIFGALAVARQGYGVFLPKFLNLLAQLLQAGDFMRFQRAGEFPAPLFETLEVFRV